MVANSAVFYFFFVAVFFMLVMNSFTGIAAKLIIWTVPLEPSSIDTRAIVLLSGASTTLTKSYGPRTTYWLITLAPRASISLLTSCMRSGRSFTVLLPSSVNVDNRM